MGTAQRNVSRSGGIIHQTTPENRRASSQKKELTYVVSNNTSSVMQEERKAPHLPIMKITIMPRPGMIVKKAASTGDSARSQQPRKERRPILASVTAQRRLRRRSATWRALAAGELRVSALEAHHAAGRAKTDERSAHKHTKHAAPSMAQPPPASQGIWSRLWGAPGACHLQSRSATLACPHESISATHSSAACRTL